MRPPALALLALLLPCSCLLLSALTLRRAWDSNFRKNFTREAPNPDTMKITNVAPQTSSGGFCMTWTHSSADGNTESAKPAPPYPSPGPGQPESSPKAARSSPQPPQITPYVSLNSDYQNRRQPKDHQEQPHTSPKAAPPSPTPARKQPRSARNRQQTSHPPMTNMTAPLMTPCARDAPQPYQPQPLTPAEQDHQEQGQEQEQDHPHRMQPREQT